MSARFLCEAASGRSTARGADNGRDTFRVGRFVSVGRDARRVVPPPAAPGLAAMPASDPPRAATGPMTASIWARLTPPGRRIVGTSPERSSTVDSMPTRHGPPSRIRSTAAPSSARTWSAVVGLDVVRLVGRRRCDRAGADDRERPQQLQRDRVIRHPQPDRRPAGRHELGDGRGRRQHQRQRPRPEGRRQVVRHRRPPRGLPLRKHNVRHMHDQRVGRRSTLHLENPRHGPIRRRVRPEAVDGFGRKRHQPAAAEDVGGAGGHGLTWAAAGTAAGTGASCS